jgi:hypothetical protein
MDEETSPVVELGKNAHGEDVVAGRYVVAPDGRIALLQHHIRMKEGWRLATDEEVNAVKKAAQR